MFLSKQHAHLEGQLSAFARRMAATETMPVEQLELNLKRRREPRPPKANPRASRPAPRYSRQFARQMPTMVMRDQRITSGAKSLAHVLVALAGRGNVIEIERWRLAKLLGRSVRTISRYLADLRGDAGTGRTCYIQTEHITDERGWTVRLRIIILPALRPYWIQEAQGVTKVSPKESLIRIGNPSARVIHSTAGAESSSQPASIRDNRLKDP